MPASYISLVIACFACPHAYLQCARPGYVHPAMPAPADWALAGLASGLLAKAAAAGSCTPASWSWPTVRFRPMNISPLFMSSRPAGAETDATLRLDAACAAPTSSPANNAPEQERESLSHALRRVAADKIRLKRESAIKAQRCLPYSAACGPSLNAHLTDVTHPMYPKLLSSPRGGWDSSACVPWQPEAPSEAH